MKVFTHDNSSLISVENLFQAWDEFKKGKRKRRDVQIFERHLEYSLFNLQQKLANKTWQHGVYSEFYVNDPKRRHIHKANVNDRIIHHLLHKYLDKIFDKTFISDSYSCRLGKGTHRAVLRLEKFARSASKNYSRNCWSLKLDIKKFFDTVDHGVLLSLVSKRVKGKDIFWLIKKVTDSFHSNQGFSKGIPLGNLTSQIFANIYLNELDQFVKTRLKAKYYLRYADDFIILDSDIELLYSLISPIKKFLKESLKLELHPNKVILRKLSWGIDFTGYIVLPHYRLLRTKTKRRIFKKLKSKIESFKSQKTSLQSLNQSLQSYFGCLSHADTYQLTQNLKNYLWFCLRN